MRIYKTKNYETMSRRAANILSAQVIVKPDCVLGLATGSTPVGVYRQLVEWYQKGDLNFSEVKSVNLDEYQGLAPEHPQSYRYFMEQHLFSHVNIHSDETHVPNGLCVDSAAECARYDQLIQDMGGIDLQILGMGHNGHIGFNEPGDAFELRTHRVQLTESTLEANGQYFIGEEQPSYAFTMGIKNIMTARKIVLVVSGAGKAEILYKALAGPVTPMVPASILQLHPDVTVVADEAALRVLVEAGVSVCE